MSTAALTLDDIAAKINTLLRAGTKTALDIGKLLNLAQKKLKADGGPPLEHWCAKNFTDYKQSSLNTYKRMASNLEIILQLTDGKAIHDEILSMPIQKADRRLAGAVRRANGAANKHARKAARVAKAASTVASQPIQPLFDEINRARLGAGAQLVDEADKTIYWFIEGALKLAPSVNEDDAIRAHKLALDLVSLLSSKLEMPSIAEAA